MVKKKQNKDSKPLDTIDDIRVNAETGEPMNIEQPEAAKMVADMMASIKEGFQAIDERFKQQDQKIAAVAKISARSEDDPPKPGNPMDYMKTITDILNSPIINKIAESLMGGGEPAGPAQPAVDPAYAKMVMEAAEKNSKYQERWMEAMIQGVELKNAQLKKEMESDIF